MHARVSSSRRVALPTATQNQASAFACMTQKIRARVSSSRRVALPAATRVGELAINGTSRSLEVGECCAQKIKIDDLADAKSGWLSAKKESMQRRPLRYRCQEIVGRCRAADAKKLSADAKILLV